MPAGMTGGPVQQITLHTSYTMQSYQVDEDAITVSWQVPRHNDVGTASNPSRGRGGGGKRMTSYNEIAHNDIHIHLHAHTHMHTHMHNPPIAPSRSAYMYMYLPPESGTMSCQQGLQSSVK